MVIKLTGENFDAVIAKGIVLVDFWADWCGPCRIIGPTIDEIANDYPQYTIANVNVDDYPELASRHGVMSIPTLLFFVDGALKDTSIGVVSKTVIEKKLEMLSN